MIDVTFWYFLLGGVCGVALWEAARWARRHW